MNNLVLPETFKRSRRSPLISELNWIYSWIVSKNFEKCNILEFGGGITTWTISEALNKKWELYCCVETYLPQVEQIKSHIHGIECVDSWDKIPPINYNIIFVDSSSGWPKGLKSIRTGQKIFRDDAVNYSLKFANNDTYYILHDWSYKGQWLFAPKFLLNNGFKLVDSHRNRFGVGIFQKA